MIDTPAHLADRRAGRIAFVVPTALGGPVADGPDSSGAAEREMERSWGR
jgi:hypothetical protein